VTDYILKNKTRQKKCSDQTVRDKDKFEICQTNYNTDKKLTVSHTPLPHKKMLLNNYQPITATDRTIISV